MPEQPTKQEENTPSENASIKKLIEDNRVLINLAIQAGLFFCILWGVAMISQWETVNMITFLQKECPTATISGSAFYPVMVKGNYGLNSINFNSTIASASEAAKNLSPSVSVNS